MPRTVRKEQRSEGVSAVPRRGRKKKKNSAVMAAMLVISLVLLAAGGLLVLFATHWGGALTTTTITKDVDELGISASALMDDSITNIAIFGVDSRNDSFSGLSDMILILTVDNRHGKLKMTSVLRDTVVPISGTALTGEEINCTEKINAAYDLGGAELAIRTLNQNFGLDIRDYVTVNFAHMAAIVDAFGGVEVTMTSDEIRAMNNNLWNLSQEVGRQAESDLSLGEIRKYPVIENEDYIRDIAGGLDLENGAYPDGTYLLNGNQAVAYSRIREIGDDYGRVNRQQQVLLLLIDRLLSRNVSDYTALIEHLLPHCETSLSLGDAVSLTPILNNRFTVEKITIPDLSYETDLDDGMDENGTYRLQYDTQRASERLNSFIYENASPNWEAYGNTGISVGVQ